MTRCVGNIHTKNYKNLLIGFQVMIKNVEDVFWDTVYICHHRLLLLSKTDSRRL